MCSVIVTVPFIPDYIKHEKRGLAFAYKGGLLALTMITIYVLVDLGIQERIARKELVFVISGSIGIVVALVFCG